MRVGSSTLLVTALGAFAAGCGEGARATSALRPVSLPDLSRLDAPAQEQIRSRHSALAAVSQRSGSPTLALAGAHGEIGKLLMAAEYYDAAEPFFANAQTLAPVEMKWPYYLGHLHRAQGQLDRSAAAFERAIALKPGDLAALSWLGAVYLDLSQPDRAEAPFVTALSLEPRLVAALFGLGRVALERRDHARAVELMERAIALDERASLIHYSLGLAYRGMGNIQTAEAHMKQRGEDEVGPPDPLMDELDELLQTAKAHETRGFRARERREWAEAADHFRRAAELAPENPSMRLNLGTALFQAGDVRGAQTAFETTVRLDPDFARAYYALGLLMETGGRDEAAIVQFSAAVQHGPALVEAHVKLAEALRRTGRAAESLAHYRDVLRADPANADARFGHAMALVRLGRYREAGDWMGQGVTLHPDDRRFAHALARVLAAAPDDRVRDGVRALTIAQALANGDRTLDLGETMAMALAEMGRYTDAAAWQRETIAAARAAGDEQFASRMADNLRLYERGQACRTPWRPDHPIYTARPPAGADPLLLAGSR